MISVVSLLATLCFCAPESSFMESPVMPVLETPPFDADAFKCVFDSTQALFSSFEITEDGRFLLTETAASEDAMPEIHYGNAFILQDTLVLEGCGKGVISQDRQWISFSADGFEHKLPYSPEHVVQHSLKEHGLCRTWKPVQTILSVKPERLPRLGLAFEGCDVAQMLDEVVSRGICFRKLRKERDMASVIERAQQVRQDYHDRAVGMKVSELTFSRAGTLIVAFEQGQPYVGYWEWGDDECTLLDCFVTVPGSKGEPFLVHSRGQVRFDAEGRISLLMDASFTSNDVFYAAYAELILTQ